MSECSRILDNFNIIIVYSYAYVGFPWKQDAEIIELIS